MAATISLAAPTLYEGFIMARKNFQPSDFGIEMRKEDFVDKLIDEFNMAYGNVWTIDELCLHPREALRFCDDLRHKHSWLYVPDDIILRSIMNARKNPN